MPRNSELGPHPVDVHVGQRVVKLRKSQGYTQTELAVALGLTFQQVQKYEKGGNRISASKLWEMARFFDVDINDFFAGLANDDDVVKAATTEQPSTPQTRAIESLAPRLTPSQQRLALEFMRDMARKPSSVR